jgi:hypothetical protein
VYFIQWSQDQAKHVLWQEKVVDPTAIQINYVGWKLLKEKVRGDPLHRFDDNFDVAAAEHYMYIRFLAGQTGDPACHAAPFLYGAKKVLDQIFGRLQSGQAQGGHPVLPSNPYVVAWGQTGVIDGLADYKSVNQGAPYKPGTAVGVLAGFSVSPDLAKKIGDYAIKSGALVPSGYK